MRVPSRSVRYLLTSYSRAYFDQFVQFLSYLYIMLRLRFAVVHPISECKHTELKNECRKLVNVWNNLLNDIISAKSLL